MPDLFMKPLVVSVQEFAESSYLYVFYFRKTKILGRCFGSGRLKSLELFVDNNGISTAGKVKLRFLPCHGLLDS
jgi:hypothetical protein